jgi:hypothetical protein
MKRTGGGGDDGMNGGERHPLYPVPPGPPAPVQVVVSTRRYHTIYYNVRLVISSK